MTLPNYFLADLPPEAELTPALVAAACQELRRNRERFLARRSTGEIAGILAELAGQWRDPAYPLLRHALQQSPAATGFPPEVLAAGLDEFFATVTVENLHALVRQDLGHAERLDRLVASEEEREGGRAAWASGPELLAHVTAGNLPIPALQSLMLGLLVRSAQFVKCARGASFLPRLFGHSLHQWEPKLGACLEIAEWPGGTEALETALLEAADTLTATGSDEAIAAIRRRVPPRVRFISHGSKASFAYVSREALGPHAGRPAATLAAQDIAAWNQHGCLSPHSIYVESGGCLAPDQWAEMLADGLERLEASLPRGPIPVEDSAAIASRRAFYEVRAAHGHETRLWCSRGSTAWTVVFEHDPLFQLSCLNRFVYVKPVASPAHVFQAADAIRGRVSTVGLGASESGYPALALEFARWGATRVCPLGQMQRPPLTWRHDGRPSLGELVLWTDCER